MIYVFLGFLAVLTYLMLGFMSVEYLVHNTCTSTRYRAFVFFCWPVVWIVFWVMQAIKYLRG